MKHTDTIFYALKENAERYARMLAQGDFLRDEIQVATKNSDGSLTAHGCVKSYTVLDAPHSTVYARYAKQWYPVQGNIYESYIVIGESV